MPNYQEGTLREGLPSPLFVRQWLPDGEPLGLVQICHGMAEHGDRYQRLGHCLAEQGYAAFCHDHRGHGKTHRKGEPLGHFADRDGWKAVVRDAIALGRVMRKRFPQGTFILFGHSMGSMVASEVAASRRGEEYDAFILCGSPAPNPGAAVAKAIAAGFRAMGQGRKPNTLLHSLVFGSSNRQFEGEGSPNAWLSSDPEEVAKYDGDPLCGFPFTAAGFYDMLDGITRVRSTGWAKRTVNRPFLLISGEQDPAGQNGKGVLWICDQLTAAGRQVKCILYPDMRHEILNERDCDVVYTDLLTWVSEVKRVG